MLITALDLEVEDHVIENIWSLLMRQRMSAVLTQSLIDLIQSTSDEGAREALDRIASTEAGCMRVVYSCSVLQAMLKCASAVLQRLLRVPGCCKLSYSTAVVSSTYRNSLFKWQRHHDDRSYLGLWKTAWCEE